MKKILIADDHQLVRLGLKMIIERMTDVEVCCIAADGSDAIAFLENSKADLAILDISMPEKSGIEVLHYN